VALALYVVLLFRLPVSSELSVSHVLFFPYQHNITDTKLHEKAKEILLEMGEFFQIQVRYIKILFRLSNRKSYLGTALVSPRRYSK
jgi:hypothetical protein